MARIDNDAKKFVKPYETTRGTRWKVIISDGRGGQVREQGFTDQQSAINFSIKEYSQILLGRNKGVNVISRRIHCSEYFKEWLELKLREGIAENTYRRYKDQIRCFLEPYFGTLKVSTLDKFHLRNYIRDSQDAGVSTYNLHSTVTLLKMIMRRAIEDDLSQNLSLLVFRTPKHRPKDPIFWDEYHTKSFLQASWGNRNILLWKFVLNSGLRAGEVAALQWDCIKKDLKSGSHKGFVLVRRTCQQKSKKIKEELKNGEQRMIPISLILLETIEELEKSKYGPFVFGGEEPLDPSHFARDLRAQLKHLPLLPKVTFHGLRHTFCSYLESTGLPRKTVSKIMGHRYLETTDRYSHVSDETLGNAFANWSKNQSQQNSNKVESADD